VNKIRYLITGINGFVGPHLAKLLIDEGHDVAGLVRETNGRKIDMMDVLSDKYYSKIDFYHGDLVNKETIFHLFSNNKFDGVFHLAAQSHPPTSFLDPIGTFNTNANGTIHIVEGIREFRPQCKLMYCSTSEVYGIVPEEKGPIDENFPLIPINPYAVSKAAADHYVRERANSIKLPFFVTRAFSHTGPKRGNIFSISSDAYQIIRIVKGYQDKVIKIGNIESKRVVIDVRDCVKAYYLLMQKFTPGEAYNIGGDRVYSIAELLYMMLEMKGLKGKVKLVKDPKLVRPIDIPLQICNSDKCRKLTGWKPKIPMEQTLKDLLDYWEEKIN